jgi:hypothetical protein
LRLDMDALISQVQDAFEGKIVRMYLSSGERLN